MGRPRDSIFLIVPAWDKQGGGCYDIFTVVYTPQDTFSWVRLSLVDFVCFSGLGNILFLLIQLRAQTDFMRSSSMRNPEARVRLDGLIVINLGHVKVMPTNVDLILK